MENLKMFHHSIIVTSNNVEVIQLLHTKAKELFEHLVTEIVFSHYNHIVSFFIAPDGGKERKKVSNEYDKRRTEFVEYVQAIKEQYANEAIQVHVSVAGHFDEFKTIE